MVENCCLIIPLTNRFELTTHLLNSINDFDDEVIFVVNGVVSNKVINNLKNYKKNRNKVKIIREEEQLTFSEANNIAVKETRCKYIIFMNSDVFPFKGALYRLMEEIKCSHQIGAVQGVLLYPQNCKIQSAGHIFFEYHNYHALNKGIIPNNFGTRKRQALSAAFCITRKELFNECDGFDTFYVNAFEGMDLTAKIYNFGYDCLITDRAKGYHLQGTVRDKIERDESNDQGKFWATTGTKLANDLIAELKLNTLNSDLSIYRRIINVSQIRDKYSLIHELFSTKLEWINLPDKTKNNIILQDNLSIHSLFSNAPTIWLTTHFSQIANNKIVFKDYSRRNDLVIDLHSNVFTINQIINN